MEKQQQRPAASLIPNLLVEDAEHDNTLTIGDYDDDARARLVP